MFLNVGVKFWLSWGAMILAVVSTASIIPEFVASGSIELSLSRPISRIRIFLTKYAAALLFAGLQVLVFSLACFLVIGLRGNAWEPRVFLAIPLVLLIFSYLYCISAIVGLITRSTIFALIAALIFWLFLFLLNFADAATLTVQQANIAQVNVAEKKLPRMEKFAREQIARYYATQSPDSPPPPYSENAKIGQPTSADLELAKPVLHDYYANLNEAKSDAASIGRWNKGLYIAKTILPKTGETAELLSRSLLSPEDVSRFDFGGPPSDDADTVAIADATAVTDEEKRAEQKEVRRETARLTDEALRSRSLWYVIGGSLAFEAVVLFFATWIFCRRDF